jgi:hypothetical protein
MFFKFVVKGSLVVGISVLFFLGIIFIIPVFKKSSIVTPPEFNVNIKDASIIVCGDSRADRQIDPAVIKSKTNLNVINIAATGQDFYTWSKALQAAGVKNKTIVISASFFQINDGANEFPLFNLGTFADMNFRQKIKMYRHNPVDFILMQTKLAFHVLFGKKQDYIFGNFQRRLNVDYFKQDCKRFEINSGWFKNHSWYKSPVTNGVKLDFLNKALTNISKLENCKVLIYNGPVSNSFMQFAGNILFWERDYDRIMATLCKNYNISYMTFLNDSTIRDDRFYYDAQHLCSIGAFEFSNKMAEILISIEK